MTSRKASMLSGSQLLFWEMSCTDFDSTWRSMRWFL